MTDMFTTPSRRRLLQLAGGAAATGLWAPAIIGRAAAATQITVADPGGPFSQAWRKAFYDPFEKATGNKVVNVAREAEPTAQFKAMVETKSYTWDVCTLTLSARDILAAQGLLEPIGFGHADVPQLMPEAISSNFMGTDVYSTVFAYRTDRVKAAPASWADFFNVEKFPGRRSLRKNPIDTLEQALLADGVPLDKLYPLDVERAFKVLDKIKPHIAVWWTGGAQSTQLLQSGEVDMLPGWNARFQAAIDGGTPAKIVWAQGLYSIEGWGMPKGGPRSDVGRQFIKFCSDPKAQALYTEILAYGPTNLDAYKTIPADRAKSLPTSPDNLKQMAIANEAWWSANRAAVTERFNSWLLV
ncbi:ABC transporter substrate-binding protein [Bosea lathyri]|uniref:Putative spermidine/putrescine transport system substrate-binding protein n=1 Tax=Bosea lathyri TaxID=1036778 RepID=A0A1H5YR01_9HYPH|nr:ABC transporter substrate-binding protein [Bosea lathyri]SEG26220.1 putative spermidine/putrescine transport system substrate-binding protein [Bosea lathyri]